MEHTLALLGEYGYLLLFPLAIVEGPIITVLAGFLVTLGVLNPFIVYAIVVAGDMVGDSWLYGVGRVGGKWLDRVSRFFRVTPEKLEQAKGFFDTHHHRTLILSKLVHGIGAAGLIAAGMLRIPYRRYVFVCVLISLAQSCIFLLIGILFIRTRKNGCVEFKGCVRSSPWKISD